MKTTKKFSVAPKVSKIPGWGPGGFHDALAHKIWLTTLAAIFILTAISFILTVSTNSPGNVTEASSDVVQAQQLTNCLKTYASNLQRRLLKKHLPKNCSGDMALLAQKRLDLLTQIAGNNATALTNGSLYITNQADRQKLEAQGLSVEQSVHLSGTIMSSHLDSADGSGVVPGSAKVSIATPDGNSYNLLNVGVQSSILGSTVAMNGVALGRNIVSGQPQTVTAAAPLLAIGVPTTKTVLIVPVAVSGATALPAPSRFQTMAQEISDFYKSSSYGLLNMTVTVGTTMQVPKPKTNYCSGVPGGTAQSANYIIYALPASACLGVGGLASIGGSTIVIFAPNSLQSYVHELGHSLRFQHSLYESEIMNQNSNQTTTDYIPPLNSVHKNMAGWVDSQTVTSDAKVQLNDFNQANGIRDIMIPAQCIAITSVDSEGGGLAYHIQLAGGKYTLRCQTDGQTHFFQVDSVYIGELPADQTYQGQDGVSITPHSNGQLDICIGGAGHTCVPAPLPPPPPPPASPTPPPTPPPTPTPTPKPTPPASPPSTPANPNPTSSPTPPATGTGSTPNNSLCPGSSAYNGYPNGSGSGGGWAFDSTTGRWNSVACGNASQNNGSSLNGSTATPATNVASAPSVSANSPCDPGHPVAVLPGGYIFDPTSGKWIKFVC
jgi:hypothetical protein